MHETTQSQTTDRLGPLIGRWRIEAGRSATGTTTFEWLPGRRFVVQRWEIDDPRAPDGLAVIGRDERGGGLLQHYFDSRGIARLYEMELDGRTWTLRRTRPDFSALDFQQRFVGRFAADGSRIDGRWERSDDGIAWQEDFELAYWRL